MFTRLIVLSIGIEASLLVLLLVSDLRHHPGIGIGVLLGASLFYLASVFTILKLPSPGLLSRRLVLLGLTVLFRLTLWPLFPAFSDDAYRYRWEGELQAGGVNPYQVAPSDAAAGRLHDSAYQNVPDSDFRAGYGPLTELLERITYSTVRRFTNNRAIQVFWFKSPAALFDLEILTVLWLFVKQRSLAPERWLLYAWCPLPAFEFWASGHNDAIAVFFLLLTLLFADRHRWWLASGALWLAGAVKLWPLMLFPLLIIRGERGSWRRLAAAILTAPVFIVCWLPYWSNVITNLRFMSGFVGGWRNNDSLFGFFLWITRGDLYHAKLIAFGVLACGLVLIAALRLSLDRAFLTAIVTLLLVSANCHPWYLTWFIPLLVFVPVPPLFLWAALMPLTYAVLFRWFSERVWNGSTPVRWWVYGPVLACGLVWLFHRRHNRKNGSLCPARSLPGDLPI